MPGGRDQATEAGDNKRLKLGAKRTTRTTGKATILTTRLSFGVCVCVCVFACVCLRVCVRFQPPRFCFSSQQQQQPTEPNAKEYDERTEQHKSKGQDESVNE